MPMGRCNRRGAGRFACAAEIIRFTNAGWSDADVAQFQNMLRTQYLPFIIHGDTENGNKELDVRERWSILACSTMTGRCSTWGSRCRARCTPAIFTSNPTVPSPSILPAPPPSGATRASCPSWLTASPRKPQGFASPVARDLVDGERHETRQQGVDLYGEQGDRIVAALEFVAQQFSAEQQTGTGEPGISPPGDMGYRVQRVSTGVGGAAGTWRASFRASVRRVRITRWRGRR